MRRSLLASLLTVCGWGCAAPAGSVSSDLARSPSAADLSSADGEPPLDGPSTVDDLAQATARDLGRSDLRGGVDLGAIPQSWASPGTAPTDVTLGWNGSYATGYRVSLGADDPSALIYYTSDGSAPGLASTHASSPVTGINIAAPTRLRWFAATAAGMEPPHDDNYGLDTSLQSKAGFVIYDVTVDGQGPVATVSGGATVNVQATFRFWYQSTGCGGGLCAAQLVYGVDKVDQGCLFDERDGGASNFAGSTAQTKTVSVTVPSTAGVHEVQVAQIEDLTCAAAMTAMALKTRPNLVRIGVVIVH